MTKAVRILGGAVATLGLTACSQLPNFGAEDPASTQGSQVLELWQLFIIAAAIVGGIVYALIFFVIIRYRRRDDELPEQTEGNNRLEIFYTVVPILIVIGLFTVTMVTQIDIDSEEDPDVVVDVVGFQWQWQFNYVGEDVSITGAPDIDPVLVLPLDTTVRFRLTSRDVIHSFFVPGFLYKRDVIPGVDNEFDVTVTAEGTFQGHCAEFCGLAHDRMNFEVRTVPEDEYRAWLEEHRSA